MNYFYIIFCEHLLEYKIIIMYLHIILYLFIDSPLCELVYSRFGLKLLAFFLGDIFSVALHKYAQGTWPCSGRSELANGIEIHKTGL